MSENDQPTTARARRAQQVAVGEREDAVDRRVPRSDPGGRRRNTTSRQRQQRLAREIADEVDVDREGVGTVARIGGMDAFLRSPGVEQWGQNLRSDFASDAEYVEPGDVAPRIDQQDITADPHIAPERRDRVADRARRGLAEEDPYAQPDDLTADVGAFGVTDARFTERGARARAGRQFADQTRLEQVGPDDVTDTDDGFGLREGPQRELAALDFAAETPVDTFDPSADITPTDGGFGLTSEAQRRVAARSFEASFDLFGSGELDPGTDIREVGGGFGLARGPAREVAAADLDRQIGEVDISPDDITLEPTDSGGFEATFETEVQR